MKNLESKKIEVKVDDIKPFINEKYIGFVIKWYGNIGWGEYTIYRAIDDDQWYADSECMDTTEDKEFLTILLKDFMNKLEVQ